MANLNEDEKNTLAITRYWFENQKRVRGVVTKLVKSFTDEDVSRLTGIPVTDVWSYVNAPKPKKPFKQAVAESDATPEVKKVLTDFVEEHAPTESKVVELLDNDGKTPSNAKFIHVSNGIIDLIDELNLEPGDRLPTTKALAEKFDVAPGVITNAIARLREKGVVNAQRGKGITVA